MSHDSTSSPSDRYPRENAVTQRYSLGRPRSFAVSSDGRLVFFVRSAHGTDRRGRLYVLDSATGDERLLVDPTELLGGEDERLSPEEQARRERMRESASGVVSFSIDEQAKTVVFALSGRLFHLDVESAEARELAAQHPVVDPRLSPNGEHIAYASLRELRVFDVAADADRLLARPDAEHVVWGLADFAAAEELERSRGFWWSPDSDRLLVERFDDDPVQTWWVSDPTHPASAPVPHRYPASGTHNAEVSLWLVTLEGERVEVMWDRTQFEYLSTVHWSSRGRPLVQLLDRRQGRAQALAVDSTTGTTELVREQVDDCWVDVVPGVPSWGPSGQLLTVEAVDDRYALCVDGVPVTPEGLQVRGVISVDDDGVLLSATSDPTEMHVWSWTPEETRAVTTDPGVHAATSASGCVVVVSATLDEPTPTAVVRAADGRSSTVTSHALLPGLRPTPSFVSSDDHNLTVAVLFPHDHEADAASLPVLLDPYGGPHGQQVLKSQGIFRESQWFADQGYAVVIADGRGTPGSPRWERAVRFDLASAVLDDQVEALLTAADRFPQLDLSRVAIRGWSFGGYLAALAVLRRPDVFHAAVAGAPVTDWRLYDTAYTERYLGLPDENPEAYSGSSLLPLAEGLSRPLMLIHGFVDDNVAVANTLQLSQRLMAAGRQHTVLPLTGVTHMTPQEDVAENLLRLQVAFLNWALREGATT
ncbi:MAG: prolyl oligopeptidase family serine peptidase [Actinomycetes bacterium]